MNRYVKGAILGVIGVLTGTFAFSIARRALSRVKPKPLKTNPELRKV